MHNLEMTFSVVVLTVVILAAGYDLRTRLVPNILSLPLLGLAVSWRLVALFLDGEAHADVLAVYVALTAGFFVLWIMTPMGGGDAKLWMALVWATPPALLRLTPLVFGLAYGGGAAAQALVRGLLRRHVFGVALPATWRVVPYVAWLTYTVAHLR